MNQRFSLGAIPSYPDARDYTARLAQKAVAGREARAFPERDVIPDNGIAAYKQKHGTCVAQSVRFGYHLRYATAFGVDFLYGGARSSCVPIEGLYPNEAANFVCKHGLAPLGDDPGEHDARYAMSYYAKHRAQLEKAAAPYKGWTWARLYSVDEIKAAVADRRHVVFCAPIERFTLDSDGLFRCTRAIEGYHEMVLRGYLPHHGSEVALVRNSWGTNWGDKGDCRMTWEDVLRLKDVIAFFPTKDIPDGKSGGDDSSDRLIPVRTLRKGHKGADVLELQRRLNALGWTLKEDGDFGTATQKAVKEFQRKNGLTADGIVGRKTREALEDA